MLLLIATGAFLFEKSKRDSAEAIVDNQKDLEKLNEMNKQIADNNSQLEVQTQTREEIKKGADDAKSDTSTDATDFLAKR